MKTRLPPTLWGGPKPPKMTRMRTGGSLLLVKHPPKPFSIAGAMLQMIHPRANPRVTLTPHAATLL